MKRSLLTIAALICGSMTMHAAAFTYNLTCVLNGLNAHSCVSGPSFGTVTITDAGSDKVTVAVDLLNAGLKFRDLMLNFTGAGFTGISSSDSQVSLSPNGFSITPYSGLFDVGNTGNQGWTGNSGYTTTLTGVGGTLTAAMFNSLDSGNKVDVGIHIQSIGSSTGGGCDGNDNGTTNCAPGKTGEGSLKVGGVLSTSAVPEPSTWLLLSSSLVGLALLRRKQAR